MARPRKSNQPTNNNNIIMTTDNNTAAQNQPFEFWQDWDKYEGMLAYRHAKTIKHYLKLKQSCNGFDFADYEMFAAFNDEQWQKGIASIRPLKDGEKLVCIAPGVYGTREGAKRYHDRVMAVCDRITAECDPQEVYVYEYNNHECALAYYGDEDAVQLVVTHFGWEAAAKLRRVTAYLSLEEIKEHYDRN